MLATALSISVTDSNLAGSTASAYEFRVTGGGAAGCGAAAFSIGPDGAAVGAADNSVLTVMDVLQATDRLSAGGDGVLYAGTPHLRSTARALYAALNQAGGI